MMQYNPTIFLKRLLIIKGQKAIYDETFHLGVNIIRGENGSGKTTIIESIIYLLGGDVRVKKNQFCNCDYVYGQFVFNGIEYTLKRGIESSESFPPIEFFEGTINESLNSGIEWFRFPNKRTNNKKSYSQILFEILNFPEQKIETNITIHDILRLVSQDQKTSSDHIFANQNYNESQIKLQTISDFLFGIGDYETIRIKNELINKEKEYNIKDGEYKQIYKIFGESDIELNYDKINSTIEEKKINIQNIEKQIIELSKNQNNEEVINNEIKTLQDNIAKLKIQILNAREANESIDFEIIDYEQFLISLNEKITAISKSQQIEKNINKLTFNICPECFQPIKQEEILNCCPLCKQPIKEEVISKKYLKIYNDLCFQKREIENILSKKKKSLTKNKSAYNNLINQLNLMETKHFNYVNSISHIDGKIKNFYIEIGYITNEIEVLNEQLKFAEQLKEIKRIKEGLLTEITNLKEKLSNIQI